MGTVPAARRGPAALDGGDAGVTSDAGNEGHQGVRSVGAASDDLGHDGRARTGHGRLQGPAELGTVPRRGDGTAASVSGTNGQRSPQVLTLAGGEPGGGDRPAGRPARRYGSPQVLAVAGWVVLVVVALVWGAEIGGSEVKLRAAPLMGRWDWRPGPGLLPAVAVGAAAVRWGPRAAARLPWRRVLALVWLASVAWTVALASSAGWHRVTEPLTTRHEYEPFAATIDDLGGFVRAYVEDLPGWPIHVQGHPPGAVVVAWLADAAGLGGAGWLAALAIGAWGGAAVAALVALRTVAGEAAARRAAPALVVLPAAVWAGTSVDALFAGLVALAVALAAVAGARGSTVYAVGAGVAFGAALLSTYGAAPFFLVVAAAVAAGAAATTTPTAPAAATGRSSGVDDSTATPGSFRRPEALARAGSLSRQERAAPARDRLEIPRARVIASRSLSDGEVCVRRAAVTGAIVGATALAVLVAAGAAGFWWFDGLNATRQAYWSGVAADRPAVYLTLVGNPAALALAAGPAVAAGLVLVSGRAVDLGHARLRGRATGDATWQPWSRRVWVLPVVALVAVVAVDLSQYSRGEVERIWLPFVPWLALAAPGGRRGWLAAQVAVGVTLQAALRSPW
jgi:hypothetical protein